MIRLSKLCNPHHFTITAILIAAIAISAGIACGKRADPDQGTMNAKATPPRFSENADRFGIMAVPADPRSPEALSDLGVGWVRFSSQMGERKRETKKFRAVANFGYKMWLTIAHRDKGNIKEMGTVGFSRSKRGGFEPRDGEMYKKLVQSTIRPIVDELRKQGKVPSEWLVIQIENEVLPIDVYPPDRPVRFWHGTADGYMRTLALAREAVKEIDPLIPIAAFGFSSEMLGEFVSARHPQVIAWGERVLREGTFDMVDVHLYNKIGDIPAKIGWVKKRWPGPLVATEVGGPDPAEGGNPSNDQALAEELPRRMNAVLAAGADRAFWVLLVETEGADERFRKMGLIDSRWNRRPAFDAYKRLIQGK